MRYTYINSKQGPFELKLDEVWQYRDLIYMFTKRSFQVSYKQTILGPLWLFINPLLTSFFYVILFGNIARLSTDGIPQLLFYMTGNALWSYFSGRVSSNSGTFTGNAHLFGKVYFPRLVIPFSDVLSGMLRFGIQFSLITVLYIYYFIKGMVQPVWYLIPLLPVIIIVLGILGMGTGIIISSFTTKYRDLNVLVGFGLQLWMYASPIVYPLSTVNGLLKTIILFNPVTMPVELFRYVLFGTGNICIWSLIWSFVCMFCVTFIGIIIFNKVERTFIDTV